MNDRQLRSFIKAADCGSFSMAARESFISTPALVQQIDLLEESLGFELFVRSTHGIALTPGGAKFYDAAVQILKIYEEAAETGRRENAAELRLPIAPEQYPLFLMEAIHTYSSLHPEQKLSMVSCQYSDQLTALRRHIIDLSVIAQPSGEYLKDVIYESLCEETLSFAMNPSHPLASRKKIRMEDLAGMKITCGSYPYLEHSFPEILKNSNAHLHLISKEYDLSLKTGSMLSDELLVIHTHWSSPYESLLKVVPSDISAGTLGVVYRRNSYDTVSALIKVLMQTVKR